MILLGIQQAQTEQGAVGKIIVIIALVILCYVVYWFVKCWKPPTD